MKKFNCAFLLACVFVFFSPLQAANNQADQKPAAHPETAKQNSQSVQQGEYEILKRNQIDDTDVLAIPYDDSEVEDEEELDQIEKKNVFHLPEAKK